MKPTFEQIKKQLRSLVMQFPNDPFSNAAGRSPTTLRRDMEDDFDRLAFHLSLVIGRIPEGGSVVDIGSGLTPFAAVLSSFGYHGIMVDDFQDRWHTDCASTLDLMRSMGTSIISCDALTQIDKNIKNNVDAVVIFDMLEHLHSTPRPMLQALVSKINIGGILLIGVPNCVNLRKRLTVPFGNGRWSAIQEWYVDPIFRGHVREPDVDDLIYIAGDLGFSDYKIIGRNWLGYKSRFGFVRALNPIGDKLLRLRPALCSNIYLLCCKTK